jgi:hypothetical protein
MKKQKKECEKTTGMRSILKGTKEGNKSRQLIHFKERFDGVGLSL